MVLSKFNAKLVMSDYLFPPSTPLSIYQIWLYLSLILMKRFHVPLKFHYKWTRLYNFMQICYRVEKDRERRRDRSRSRERDKKK